MTTLPPPRISPWATAPGVLPFTKGPVRFAFGDPDGLTSNAWRAWVAGPGDVYLACRDNMRETKVSLHASGRWRMGFTSEAITKRPDLLAKGQNRAWEVWDEPTATLPNTVAAFRLFFLTPELAVRSDQRTAKDWGKVLFIEPAPAGKLAAVTLFITSGDTAIHHQSEPSFRLAALTLGNGRWAQLVAHFDPVLDMPGIVENGLAQGRAEAKRRGVVEPPGSYAYFLGRNNDGARFIIGARVHR